MAYDPTRPPLNPGLLQTMVGNAGGIIPSAKVPGQVTGFGSLPRLPGAGGGQALRTMRAQIGRGPPPVTGTLPNRTPPAIAGKIMAGAAGAVTQSTAPQLRERAQSFIGSLDPVQRQRAQDFLVRLRSGQMVPPPMTAAPSPVAPVPPPVVGLPPRGLDAVRAALARPDVQANPQAVARLQSLLARGY